ncbi:MAG: glutamine--tRNA ligase/YqeY domain fusion protein [Clostridia bacterium]|nr:glutamine--tRNA ligase/YqeY domain fusion protein [Clostridia bacterium]
METDRSNFIWDAIEQDLSDGRYQEIHTRFPPEPNGYMHIGHCKALIMDFLTAEKFGGKCNLRFDDTNPAKEDTEYVENIKKDIHWLGFHWTGGEFYASDYYDKCYEIAEDWIRRGLAYVDELSKDEMREYRGTLTEPGKNSPWRDRPWEESLDLFRRMRAGEFPEGSKTLRAKIDMASPNVVMRDPAMYRILYKEHWRTGNKWCIYPMYDFAHPIGDALEGISHSMCSLEYEIHRPLYDWVVEKSANMLPARPRQIEFARLNMTQTVMSKRYLRALVEGGYVRGWDDPRMPTLTAMRRRGYTGQAIRDFVDRIGMSKADSLVDFALLESCVRADLDERSARAMAVLHPVKVILTNWPEGEVKTLTMENHPKHPEMGTHTVTFGRELYIEAEDFLEEPVKGYKRMYPGNEVRLKGAYIVRCDGCEKDAEGNITAVYCTVDFSTESGTPGADRKIKGATLHWVHAADSVAIEGRLYEPLLTADGAEAKEDIAAPEEAEITEEAADLPEEEAEEAAVENSTDRKLKEFIRRLNPHSLEVLHGWAEPCVKEGDPGTTWQFMRIGYFCKDPDSTDQLPVFNRTVGLRDTFAKQVKK